MRRYAVLLRAVNLGSHGRVSMADLRRLLESLGYADVRTYLQSGNAVVSSSERDPGRLGRAVEKALSDELGIDTGVLVRTGPELAAVIAGNPFPEALAKPALLHVAFLSADPTRAAMAGLDPAAYTPDEFRLGDRAVYLRYATGSGRSKLGPALGRVLAPIGVVATARNWNTVKALADMTAGGTGS
jgi:uncharacterized protein (DUF1697 family)